MKLVKPNWVTHDGSPIFSVDIHPDGKRFATGGQGGDSGRVVIWNMEPVLDKTFETDSNIPKLLCQMDHHLACVNCVRWSKGGLLASGGDDKLIMIWRFCPGVKGSTLFGSKAGIEMWRCQTTLRCHQGDILDLAWAPHNPWLASASVDNTVIIWNTTNSAIMSVLRGHTGLVKGVTWDPIGRYIASQSDDKSLIVWRTTDWKQETVITEPFEDCGGTTHVLRLSWSPDGQYLVSAHAMNGGGPTAQIIERDGWKHDKDYVGHRKAVTCVRFNGNILQKKTSADKKPINFCCVAIGSRDRSLSVWSTCLKRPLVVMHELFVSSILDISWSACGTQLCACSKDGTVVFVHFTDKEIGQPVDASQQVSIQERLYGKLNKGGNYIIEDPELLICKPPAPPSATITKPPSPVKPAVTINSINSAQKTNSNSASTASVPVSNKQIETKTTDGKRRITPMFIPPPSDVADAGPSKPVVAETSSFSSSSQTKSSIVIEKRDEVVRPNVGSTINVGSTSQEKEPKSTLEQAEPSGDEPSDTFRWPSPDRSSRRPVERGSKTILLPPLQPTRNICQIAGLYSVSVNKDQNLYHLKVYRGAGEELLWGQILGYKVTSCAATPSIVVVSLEDGTVHTFYTAQGNRATPPLVPPSPIAKLQAAGNMIMVISCYADVRIWEVLPQNVCRLVISTTAAHLLTPGTTLLVCALHNGIPYISLSNARAYIYHKEMGTWILAGDTQDPTWRWALVSANSNTGHTPTGPLASLQEGIVRTAGLLPYLGAPYGATCIMSFFEQQLLVSKAIKSPLEYAHWLLTFVHFLCTHDDVEAKLRPILDELLGPVHETAGRSSWDPMIMGQSKHKLLEEILKILSNHLQWQRLYLEYTEQFKALKEFLKSDDQNS